MVKNPNRWRLITVEISGRMRDMSKKVLKRKLISVLFEIIYRFSQG